MFLAVDLLGGFGLAPGIVDGFGYHRTYLTRVAANSKADSLKYCCPMLTAST